MVSKAIQETFFVDGLEVRVTSTGGTDDYISLTDLAKKKTDDPRFAIGNWMRLKDTIELLGIWEGLHNPSFDREAFDSFAAEAGRNAFTMTPTKWINATHAIGIRTKAGRTGGTFAHVDIALDFAAWISPEFRLWVFQEYRRLKMDESSRLHVEWRQNRMFASLNYRIHTDAIKETLPVDIDRRLAAITYANEADLLNLVLFGQTAREWKAANPDAEGNMRDHASVSQNLILSNLESMNAQLLRQGLDRKQRYRLLYQMARDQEKTFEHHPTVKKLEDEQQRLINGRGNGQPVE